MLEIFKDVLENLFRPIYMMYLVSTFLPLTVSELVRSIGLSVVLSPSAVKAAWFARFWAWFSPRMRMDIKPRVQPLIAKAHGVVLDIGPGSGEWLSCFDVENVTKIYGVEPNKEHHALLRQRIKEAGLSDVYVIVPVGVEELGEEWVEKGNVDSLVTIQCLCSVPNPREMINELYGYIKEGGQWIVWEHVVVTHQGRLIGLYQAAVNLLWPHFLGGCSLTVHTEKYLKAAGTWKEVELKQPEDQPSYSFLPFLYGVLKK